jgi:hypothetical protein
MNLLESFAPGRDSTPVRGERIMRHTTDRRRSILALAASLALVPAMSGAQAPEGTSSALFEGVVIDAATGTAFVMSPKGGVDAVDLATGARKWNSRAAVRPIMIGDGGLLAQAPPSENGLLEVVTLDTAAGIVKDRMSLELPAGINASVIDTPAQKTRVGGYRDAGGDAVVTWDIERKPARGMAPAGVDEIQRLRGGARLDRAARRAVAVAVAGDDEGLSNLTIEEMSQLRSIDGRHLMRVTHNPDRTNLAAPYSLSISDESGATIATIDSTVSLTPFIVIDSTLYYVAQPSIVLEGGAYVSEPLRLKAISLASGTQAWAAPVLDILHVGMLPP